MTSVMPSHGLCLGGCGTTIRLRVHDLDLCCACSKDAAKVAVQVENRRLFARAMDEFLAEWGTAEGNGIYHIDPQAMFGKKKR